MKAMAPAAWAALEADVRILEGDAALGRDAQPARRFEIDVGMRLGVLDVVARRQRREAVEQAGAAEMVLGRGAVGRRGDGQRQAAVGQEVQQLDDARLHRDAALHQAAARGREVLAELGRR